jgi:PmbA protein
MRVPEKLLAAADEAEVFLDESVFTRVEFESGRLKSVETEERQVIALRVSREGRLGFASATQPVDEKALIERALESAAEGEEAGFVFPGPATTPDVPVHDPALADMSLDQLIDLGREVVAWGQGDPDLAVDLDMERRVQTVRLANSHGTFIEIPRTVLSLYMWVERIQSDDVLVAFDSGIATRLDESGLKLAHRTAQRIEWAKKVVTLRSGRMPAVFSPQGAYLLFWPLLDGLNGNNVRQRISPLAEKIGERVIDPKLSLIEDGTLPFGPVSGAYDDEGVPRLRRPLIENGVARSFFYDLKSAALAGTCSTGNGTRLDSLNPPQPWLTNVLVSEGETSLEAMLAPIRRGVFIDIPLNLGRGDTLSGDFSSSLALAYKIEHGEIVGRIKDAAIAGNVYNVLSEGVVLSDAAEWSFNYLGPIRTPHVSVPELRVVKE